MIKILLLLFLFFTNIIFFNFASEFELSERNVINVRNELLSNKRWYEKQLTKKLNYSDYVKINKRLQRTEKYIEKANEILRQLQEEQVKGFTALPSTKEEEKLLQELVAAVRGKAERIPIQLYDILLQLQDALKNLINKIK